MERRLNERVNVEKSFTKCLAVLDYEPTTEVLDAVYKAVMAGAKVSDIVHTLELLTYSRIPK